MAVPTVITDLSATASLNSPSGSESAKGTVDDYFRAHAAFIKQNYDALAAKAPLASPTFTGTVAGITAAMVGAVATTGNETVAGVKTFSSSPVVPAPTTDLQAATKKYVDDKVASPAADIAMSDHDISGIKTATFNGMGSLSTTSGTIAVDFTAAQKYVQASPTGTITYTFTDPVGYGSSHTIFITANASARTVNLPANVVQYGASWTGTKAGKGAVIVLVWDGTNYHCQASDQV